MEPLLWLETLSLLLTLLEGIFWGLLPLMPIAVVDMRRREA